jgi:competence protein ComGF
MNNRGFTLIEVLLSMMVMVILLISILSLYLLYKKEESRVFVFSQLQNQSRAFVCSIERELYNGRGFSVSNGKLAFYDAIGNVISYERWGDGIRRQVNNSGHIWLVKDVESVIFTVIRNACRVQYTLKKGGITVKGEITLTSRVER